MTLFTTSIDKANVDYRDIFYIITDLRVDF